MTDENRAFQELTPDFLLDAIDATGHRTDGRFLALNSYENRVYQIGLEDAEPIIAKFYRPNRWTAAAIEEEHAFTLALAEADIPVVAPIADSQQRTLLDAGAFQFALYPRRGGHPPEPGDAEQMRVIGRLLARIHSLGEVEPFVQRPTLNMESFGREPANFLLENQFIPLELERTYSGLIDHLLTAILERSNQAESVRQVRLHGDCGPNNILCRDGVPHIVDFDDARNGPAVQDLWLLLAGDRAAQTRQLNILLTAYQAFRDFDPREVVLIEVLRTLRIIHYAGWLAKRWDDPAFRMAFPWFNTPRYWDDHILTLREQQAALNEPPLELDVG